MHARAKEAQKDAVELLEQNIRSLGNTRNGLKLRALSQDFSDRVITYSD